MHQLMSGQRDIGCWLFGKCDFAIKIYNKNGGNFGDTKSG